jgi:hypothetical protein
MEQKAIYVFEKATGKLLRVIRIDMGAAAPMTYLHAGKQYIVVAAGGGERCELVAFSVGTSAANSR